MCNLYSITTNQAEIIALFRVINRYVGNLPNAGRVPGLRRTRDRQHRRRDREGADAVGHAATGQNGWPAGIFATRPRRTSARDSRRRRTVAQNLKRLAARKHVIPNPSGDTATLTELPNSRSCNHTLTNAMTAARQHSPPTQTYKRYNILPVRLMSFSSSIVLHSLVIFQNA